MANTAKDIDLQGVPPAPPGLPPPPDRRGGGRRIVFTAVIAAVNAAVAALFVVPLFFGTNPVDVLSNRQEDQVREVQEVTTVEERVIKADQEAVAEAAQKALPCTVNLEVEIGRVGVGIGSGFIYSPDGYIVTNNHVVEDATSITVALQDGTTFEAGIVGTDPETDLAVIKIDATGLPAVELGTSSDLAVGELAMAIGSPEGFQGSVTSGIISALNRNVYVSDSTPLLDVIQTDAAINPGNSGGPLCNIKGEVVGINTAIYSESGGYDGLGFAIPIDGARPVIEQLIETGVAVHPWLGFTGSTLETEVAERYGLPVDEGAIVRSVVEDAPAQKAGLEAGDIITAIDGTVVESMDQLMLELRKHQVGDTVTVDFYRGDEAMQARATLEEKPAT